jgi:hypothetical protein
LSTSEPEAREEGTPFFVLVAIGVGIAPGSVLPFDNFVLDFEDFKAQEMICYYK